MLQWHANDVRPFRRSSLIREDIAGLRKPKLPVRRRYQRVYAGLGYSFSHPTRIARCIYAVWHNSGFAAVIVIAGEVEDRALLFLLEAFEDAILCGVPVGRDAAEGALEDGE